MVKQVVRYESYDGSFHDTEAAALRRELKCMIMDATYDFDLGRDDADVDGLRDWIVDTLSSYDRPINKVAERLRQLNAPAKG